MEHLLIRQQDNKNLSQQKIADLECHSFLSKNKRTGPNVLNAYCKGGEQTTLELHIYKQKPRHSHQSET